MSLLASLLELVRVCGEKLLQHLPLIGAWRAGQIAAERDRLAGQAQAATAQLRIAAEPAPSPNRILEDMENGRF